MTRPIVRKCGIGRDELWQEHLLSQTPVVLRDIGDGHPVRALGDLEQALRAIADAPLTVRGEYTSGLLRRLAQGPTAEPGSRAFSFGAYWQHVREEPRSPLMCIEEGVPSQLSHLLPQPPICCLRDGSPDPAIRKNLFVGNAGNYASLHFDGDCRHVLLYQVFGRKRVVLVPAVRWRALRPIVNFATLRLQALAEPQKRQVLDSLGAWETVIEPGDAIVMPALMFHYVEYIDDGMSLNFRFGRHGSHARVSEQLHVDAHTNLLAAASLDEHDAEGGAWLRRVLEAHDEPAPTPWMKYLEMRRLVAELLAQRGEPSVDEPELSSDVYVRLPEVVRQCLLRMHLFNQRLYRYDVA